MASEQRTVHRLGEQIALPEAAAGGAQEVALRRGLDAFGDDRGAVHLGDVQQRQDQFVALVGTDLADELARRS